MRLKPNDATLITARCQVLDQAPGEVEKALVSLWSLMRFLSLRLKPKAAATPRIGRGPGTALVAVAQVTLVLRETGKLGLVLVPRILISADLLTHLSGPNWPSLKAKNGPAVPCGPSMNRPFGKFRPFPTAEANFSAVSWLPHHTCLCSS